MTVASQSEYPVTALREPVKVLLVEDNPGDVRLVKEAFREANVQHQLYVASDGLEALAFLRQEGQFHDAPRPDVILLDLNLPRLDGRTTLEIIKTDHQLRYIPIIVLTTSNDRQDVLTCYDLHANCYITKPIDYAQFDTVIRRIDMFWFGVVTLPHA
ncbi:MAG: response regulator [Anaerolineae bacterium]|nr:response regulator [Anaerolineae bacterium]